MLAEVSPPVDYSLPGVLHYLQAEWRRFERERNEWTIERAELKARIALLEGERRGVESLKGDLIKRVKMLEYALRQERKRKQLDPTTEQQSRNGATDEDMSSPSSYHVPKPLNVIDTSSTTPTPHAVADTKLREKSRQALKTCLQEINYLTSIPSKVPLTYSFANSVRMKNRSPPSSSTSTSPTTRRPGPTPRAPSKPTFSPSKSPTNTILTTSTPQPEETHSDMNVADQPSPPPIDNVDEVEMLANATDTTLSSDPGSDHDALSKKMQEKYNLSNEKVQKILKNANKGIKKTRSTSPEPQEMDLSTLDTATTKNQQQSETPKLWKTKMTFKGHLDSVRAVAFHPSDLLVATGSDDGTVKVIPLQRDEGKK
ncbi:hypothetical protein [Absidia glauca]|uniref:Striatin N-terminal domain-containing protein n=1 Tax=Absidia glauca TaxID=4829 RepID=A0A168MM17_ABSGL|nr:hypothetical protein [Absidia glauca]